MSSNATPPPSESGSATGSAPAAAAGGEEWRSSVLQSYRNTEVREIANVLASLEPGTTSSSKLMLAMKFEDSIFKSAKSLDEYRKTLTKRLRKLQKKYASGAGATAAPAGGAGAGADGQPETSAQQLLLELKHKYGDMLRYIYTNSAKAIDEVKERQGQERAMQLQIHTDSARQWALDLGVVDPNQQQLQQQQSKDAGSGSGGGVGTVTRPIATVSTTNLSLEKLLKLQHHLDRRVDNIRSYVVKHADPDLFLQETLIRKDNELNAKAMKFLGTNITKRMQMLSQQQRFQKQQEQQQQQGGGSGSSTVATTQPPPTPESLFDPQKLVQSALEKAQITVPPPTRNVSNDIPAALLHLEKLRNASTAIMAYVATTDRSMAPRGALVKAHTIAIQGMEFVKQVAKKQRDQEERRLQQLQQEQQQQQQQQTSPATSKNQDDYNDDDDDDENKQKKIMTANDYVVSLEDAWTKVLELPSNNPVTDSVDVDNPSSDLGGGGGDGTSSSAAAVDSSNKRPKVNSHVKPVFKSRVLLRPNRKIPPNLLPALKMKCATLVRPPPSGMGSHLVLDFGWAFRMTIYFSPLVVTIRALSEEDIQKIKQKDNNTETDYLGIVDLRTTGSSAKWTPLYHGLKDAGTVTVENRNKRNTNNNTTNEAVPEKELNVWGVRGSYKVLGHVAEERLRDASNHATYVLRKCFQNSVKDKTNEFEVEILEATALLEFLQLARTTYIPKWQDADQ